MNEGKKFEKDWSDSMESYMYYMRIKDTSSSFSPGEKSKFTTKSPFDCLIFWDGNLFTIELKTTIHKSFTFERTKLDKGKNIKLHQIVELQKSSLVSGVESGFVLNFINSNTYWLPIGEFMKFFNGSDKKSINEKDILDLDHIIIQKSMKRTRYRYNVELLLRNIKQQNKTGFKPEN